MPVAQWRAESVMAKPAACGQRAFASVLATGRSANGSQGRPACHRSSGSIIGMQAGRLRYRISAPPQYRRVG